MPFIKKIALSPVVGLRHIMTASCLALDHFQNKHRRALEFSDYCSGVVMCMIGLRRVQSVVAAPLHAAF
jgi:hypothetical protein